MSTPHGGLGVRLGSITFEPWQLAACDAWAQGDEAGTYRGTLEIFTGGGKSVIALECVRRAAELQPDLRLLIVVPSMALVRQWRSVLREFTALPDHSIGELHGARKDDLARCKVLITVLNTASQQLPALAQHHAGPLMLVVDECHRAGATEFSRVLDTRADFRLGLSATAERGDVDDEGFPIEYDDHVLGRKLGSIVYRFDLKAARAAGWLPEFTVHHHAVALDAAEQRKYEEMSRKIDDLADQLRDLGVETSLARRIAGAGGEPGRLAAAYVGAVSLRKDLLFRARERSRVVVELLLQLAQRETPPRVLLFHERIDEAVALHERLSASGLPFPVELEHSRLPESRRTEALRRFADGRAPVLVSVKSLIEGINVPDADVGVSVASSSSVRQRVQALGRVLRRRFDGELKTAEMHLLYVTGTVDEAIYEKEDWSDLTGSAANFYLDWPLDAGSPAPLPGPPRTPRPTEEQFWSTLEGEVLNFPLEWPCEWPRHEWRLDSRGTVTDLAGYPVANPQHVAESVRRVKPGGGRFRVSDRHLLLVVPDPRGAKSTAWLVGKLAEPLRPDRPADPEGGGGASTLAPPDEQADVNALSAGQSYEGPKDRAGGEFKIRQKSGGVITRRRGSTVEFAETSPSANAELADNAVRVLEAWRSTGETGMNFFVDSADVAYYTSQGSSRFLAHVPGGFLWPSSEENP